MSYAPIVLEDKDFKYIIKLIEKDLAGAKSVVEDCDIIEDSDILDFMPNINGVRKEAEENVKQAEELLEQLRYFYRHFKVRGKN